MSAQSAEKPSPLAEFARSAGLHGDDHDGMNEAWPEYDESDWPDVCSTGHQVFVHAGYTVSMPRTFGAYFYARGGRVSVELIHAHHPIICEFCVHWPWDETGRARVAPAVQSIIAELTAADGPLCTRVGLGERPAWRTRCREFECDLTIAVVFDEIVEGFAEIDSIVRKHGGKACVSVREAVPGSDCLADMRPCSPGLAQGFWDIELVAVGPRAIDLEECIRARERRSA